MIFGTYRFLRQIQKRGKFAKKLVIWYKSIKVVRGYLPPTIGKLPTRPLLDPENFGPRRLSRTGSDDTYWICLSCRCQSTTHSRRSVVVWACHWPLQPTLHEEKDEDRTRSKDRETPCRGISARPSHPQIPSDSGVPERGVLVPVLKRLVERPS